MKRAISFFMTIVLCMLFNITVSAGSDDTIIVEFVVEPTYTVSIPESVTLTYNEATNNYVGFGIISVPACRLEKYDILNVEILGSQNAENDILYMVTPVGARQQYTIISELKIQQTGNGSVSITSPKCGSFETSTSEQKLPSLI